jgi:hypothetical protein
MMRFVASLLASVLCAAPACAGVVLTMESGGPDGAKRQTQIFLEPDRLKMPQGRGAMIYRGDQDKTWSYDDERKVYVELTREGIGQMKAQMDAAMAQLQQRLASLPPEQRKAVEEMVAKQGGGSAALGQPPAPVNVTYEKAGGAQTVGKWRCEGYARLENGRKVDDLCIAKLTDLGMTREDLKAFAGLTSMLRDLNAPAGLGLDFEGMMKAIGFEGAPVRSVHYMPDGRQVESTVKSVERKSLPPTTFNLPTGYAKQEMPKGPGR